MKQSTTIPLIGLFFLIMAGLASLLIAPDVIHGQSTPSLEVADNPAPQLTGSGVTLSPTQALENQNVYIKVEAYDLSGVGSVVATVRDDSGAEIASVPLYDNGQQDDGAAGDGIFAATWNVGARAEGVYPIDVTMADKLNNEITISGVVQLAIGAGACLGDGDCTAGARCCSGSCAVDTCSVDTDCDDADVSTADTCLVTSCPAVCDNTPITTCTSGDSYCPTGCDFSTDTDCADSTAPFVSIDAPASGDTIDTATYTVSVTASDTGSGLDKVEFYLDTETTPRETQIAPATPGSDVYNWVVDVPSLGNGAHDIIAKAYDMVGNAATDTISVTVAYDTSAPVNVSIASPAAGSSFASGSTINVSVHAEDDTSVTSVEVYSIAGGGPINTVTSSGTTVDVVVPIAAAAIAYFDSPTQMLAERPSGWHLPFIHAADAATNTNCTTTTTNHPKTIYAVAYDTQNNSTNSATLDIIVTTSTTTCSGGTNTATPTGGSAL